MTFGLWLSLRQVSVSLAGFASRNGTAMTSVSPLRTFAAFAAAHPDVKVSFRELSFPCGSPSSWLADVDVALCYSPTPHPHICIHELRSEPREWMTC